MRFTSAMMAAAILGGGLTSAAQAQTAPPATPTARVEPAAPAVTASSPAAAATFTEIDDDDVMVPQLNRSVEDLEDMDLYDAAGNEIGEVEEVLADASGNPVALAVELDDRTGDDDVIIMLDQVTLTDDRLTTSLSKDQLEALPTWDD